MIKRKLPPIKQRKLFFEGNSLFDLGSADSSATSNYGFEYVPSQAYSQLLGNNLAMFSFAISGQTGTQILAAASSKIMNNLQSNDIVVYWEGTNDMYLNALSGASAFANVVGWLNLVTTKTNKIIIGTVTARDYVSDPGDLMTRISDYNALVRSNASTYGYSVWDIGAELIFDTRADASNATNYFTDKLHHTKVGRDSTVIPTLVTKIQSLI